MKREIITRPEIEGPSKTVDKIDEKQCPFQRIAISWIYSAQMPEKIVKKIMNVAILNPTLGNYHVKEKPKIPSQPVVLVNY